MPAADDLRRGPSTERAAAAGRAAWRLGPALGHLPGRMIAGVANQSRLDRREAGGSCRAGQRRLAAVLTRSLG